MRGIARRIVLLVGAVWACEATGAIARREAAVSAVADTVLDEDFQLPTRRRRRHGKKRRSSTESTLGFSDEADIEAFALREEDPVISHRLRREKTIAAIVTLLAFGLLYYVGVSSAIIDEADTQNPNLNFVERYMLAVKNHPAEMSIDISFALIPSLLAGLIAFREFRHRAAKRRAVVELEDDGDFEADPYGEDSDDEDD